MTGRKFRSTVISCKVDFNFSLSREMEILSIFPRQLSDQRQGSNLFQTHSIRLNLADLVDFYQICFQTKIFWTILTSLRLFKTHENIKDIKQYLGTLKNIPLDAASLIHPNYQTFISETFPIGAMGNQGSTMGHHKTSGKQKYLD